MAGPESANNSAAGGSFIPLLTLGIPANAVMAIFLGALMIHGLQPGPLLMTRAPDLFWGTIVSMYIGNGMLLVLNLPLIPLWVMVLRVPYYLLYPLIILFCLIGSYSIGNNAGDVLVMLIFGIVGYLMRKFRYDGAPMVLALVLGGELETSLRQSLMLSRGDFSIFVSRPISLGFLNRRNIVISCPHHHSAKEALHLGGTLTGLQRSSIIIICEPIRTMSRFRDGKGRKKGLKASGPIEAFSSAGAK